MSKLVSIHKALQLKKDASREEFDIWCLKYKAVAQNLGHLEIMIGTDSVPKDTTDSEYIEKKKLNDEGYSHLLLSVTSDNDILKVAESATADLQTRCLKTSWNSLQENYSPKTGRTKNELIDTFYTKRIHSMKVCSTKWINGML